MANCSTSVGGFVVGLIIMLIIIILFGMSIYYFIILKSDVEKISTEISSITPYDPAVPTRCGAFQVVYNGKCLHTGGQYCSSDSDCASGTCFGGTCKVENGGICETDNDCGNNSECIFSTENTLFKKNSKRCVGTTTSSSCNSGNDCLSNICNTSTNKCQVLQGNSCSADSDCFNSFCIKGTCINGSDTGNSCDSNGSCTSGSCSMSNQCIALSGKGLVCKSDSDCGMSGVKCNNGVCDGTANQSDTCIFINNSSAGNVICSGTLECLGLDQNHNLVPCSTPGQCTCQYFDGITTYSNHYNFCPSGSVLGSDGSCKGNSVLNSSGNFLYPCFSNSQCTSTCSVPSTMLNVSYYSYNSSNNTSSNITNYYNYAAPNPTQNSPMVPLKVLFAPNRNLNGNNVNVIYTLVNNGTRNTLLATYSSGTSTNSSVNALTNNRNKRNFKKNTRDITIADPTVVEITPSSAIPSTYSLIDVCFSPATIFYYLFSDSSSPGNPLVVYKDTGRTTPMTNLTTDSSIVGNTSSSIYQMFVNNNTLNRITNIPYVQNNTFIEATGADYLMITSGNTIYINNTFNNGPDPNNAYYQKLDIQVDNGTQPRFIPGNFNTLSFIKNGRIFFKRYDIIEEPIEVYNTNTTNSIVQQIQLAEINGSLVLGIQQETIGTASNGTNQYFVILNINVNNGNISNPLYIQSWNSVNKYSSNFTFDNNSNLLFVMPGICTS